MVLHHTFIETLVETLKMLPLLLVAFLVIEIIESRALDKLRRALASRHLGVISAAVLGIFPQCGFSAAAAKLCASRLISGGALIAVFISTSDEAIPLLAAKPEQAKWLLPLIAVKLIWAIIAGYAVDFILTRLKLNPTAELKPAAELKPVAELEPAAERIMLEYECDCGCCDCEEPGGGAFQAARNAISRTLSIALFILVTSFILHLAVHLIGNRRLAMLLMTDSIFQPMLAALLGLLPSCAVSVVLSELFAAGTLSFGSLCAGLCSGAGVGLLVLLRESRDTKQSALLIGLLYLFSALIGIILQLII